MLFDNFERADGAPGTAPTGHIWQEYGSKSSTITSGQLVKASTGPSNAFYLGTELPKKIKKVSLKYGFNGTDGDNCAVVILVSPSKDRNVSGVPLDMAHIVFARAGVNVDYYLNGSATNVDSFAQDLALDGTVYESSVEFNGDSIIITLPDGSVETVTDSNLDLSGRYLTIECFTAADQDAEPFFEEILVTS